MDSFSYIFPYNNLVVNSTGLFNITFPLVHLQLRMLVTLTIIINQENHYTRPQRHYQKTCVYYLCRGNGMLKHMPGPVP